MALCGFYLIPCKAETIDVDEMIDVCFISMTCDQWFFSWTEIWINQKLFQNKLISIRGLATVQNEAYFQKLLENAELNVFRQISKWSITSLIYASKNRTASQLVSMLALIADEHVDLVEIYCSLASSIKLNQK